MSNGTRALGVGSGLLRGGFCWLFIGPLRIYDFFDKGSRYHFAQYLPILVSIVLLFHTVTTVAQKSSFGGKLFAFVCGCLITAISAGGLSRVASFIEKLGWWFAWYPGLGYKKKNGSYKPLFSFAKTGATSSSYGLGGAAKADETLLRGAAVVDGNALAKNMKQGIKETASSMLIEIGGVPVPYGSEPQHFLIEGMTGAGKTQAINAVLRIVRKRQQAAIIADPGAGYLSRFGTDTDLILNPLDARSVGWSPFAEIRESYDCQMIAKAAIPDAVGEASEWNFYAQTMLAAALKMQWKAGDYSMHRLLYLMNSASVKELEPVLAGTPAYPMIQKGGEKALASIRMIAAVYLASWEYLPDTGTFSVRKWVRESDKNPNWLYLTYRDDQMAMLRNLVSCWLELAIVEGLTLEENDQRRLWYIMDELDSLGKVTSLRGGLTKLRKYGGVCVSGLQTIAQLRTTYGKDEAQTLLSCMGTKLVLRAGDNETGKYFENELGEQEIERKETSSSTSTRLGDMPSNSENTSQRRTQQMAVLASEIQGLPDLQGYLKLIGLPIARVALQYVGMPKVKQPFVSQSEKEQVTA